MRSSLFARLLRPRRESPEVQEDEWLAKYTELRERHGPISGTGVVPTSLKSVYLLAGSLRVLKQLTLTPGASNSGTISVGGPQVAGGNGVPLTKTSAPLVFQDVLLGDLAFTGTVAGDSLYWAGS